LSISKLQRVAILGASSQIGKVLVPKLESLGYIVFSISRDYKTTSIKFKSYTFDDINCCFIPHIENADVVINLAPLPLIDKAIGIAKILKAKRIIAFGSTGRFTKIDSTSDVERDFVAQQKQAEDFFSNICENLSISWTLFRPTMIYGNDMDKNISFIRSLIRKFGIFFIPFGANGLRQPVHVNDLANACILAMESNLTINKSYNLGGLDVIPLRDLVIKIFQSENKKPIFFQVPKSFFNILILVLNRFPRYKFLRIEMVDRMHQNLIVDNSDAIRDFSYNPQILSI
jgi:nucleoside-diphosphate-sugar epimerase